MLFPDCHGLVTIKITQHIAREIIALIRWIVEIEESVEMLCCLTWGSRTEPGKGLASGLGLVWQIILAGYEVCGHSMQQHGWSFSFCCELPTVRKGEWDERPLPSLSPSSSLTPVEEIHVGFVSIAGAWYPAHDSEGALPEESLVKPKSGWCSI